MSIKDYLNYDVYDEISAYTAQWAFMGLLLFGEKVIYNPIDITPEFINSIKKNTTDNAYPPKRGETMSMEEYELFLKNWMIKH